MNYHGPDKPIGWTFRKANAIVSNMKRLVLTILALGFAGCLYAESLTIQVKQASLYAKPTPTSQFLGRLVYGTSVSVTSEKEGWLEISVDGKAQKGWVRTFAVSQKSATTKATASTASGVSDTEVSLAGRGFTAQIESAYREKNPTLDYADLDKMDGYGLPDDALMAFLRTGGLNPQGAR